MISTKTPIRVINASNKGGANYGIIKPSDNGGYIYVDFDLSEVKGIELAFSKDLPVGFSCVVVQSGTARVELTPLQTGPDKQPIRKLRSGSLKTARGGHTTRAKYSAIGIIKDTPTTVTVTGDAE